MKRTYKSKFEFISRELDDSVIEKAKAYNLANMSKVLYILKTDTDYKIRINHRLYSNVDPFSGRFGFPELLTRLTIAEEEVE